MALSYGHDRKYSAHPECRSGPARGCVNNARLLTFIREIRVENFVNETRTNKRFALSFKRTCDTAWKFRLQIISWNVFIAATITLTDYWPRAHEEVCESWLFVFHFLESWKEKALLTAWIELLSNNECINLYVWSRLYNPTFFFFKLVTISIWK